MGCGSSSCASQPGPVSGGFGRKPHVEDEHDVEQDGAMDNSAPVHPTPSDVPFSAADGGAVGAAEEAARKAAEEDAARLAAEEAARKAEKAHAGRLARLAAEWAALGGASVALQPCKPLRERIGLGARRHERGEWKTLLLAPTTLHEQGRDSELDLKILRGDITADVRVYVLQQDKRIVSFLLSSTFTDTEWERNLLIDDVVPYLQDYARKHGFEFRLAEMRW